MVRPGRFVGVRGLSFEFDVAARCNAQDFLAGFGLSKHVIGRAFSEGQFVGYSSHGAESLLPGSVLSPGDIVALISRVTRTAPQTTTNPPVVLYEDPFLIAVDKLQCILVHSDGTGAPTLTDHIVALMRRQGSPLVPQAIQRLDYETSGVVIFSKTEEWQCLFDSIIAKGDVEKRYLAIVEGLFDKPTAVFRDRIGRDRHDAKRMRVAPNGLDAVTFVRRLAVDRARNVSLLDVKLGTGRRHQIRVHLSAHGFPVVNDPLYARSHGTQGLMLHAYRETFDHPVTGERVDVRSFWPERFSTLFEEIDLSV